MPSNYITCPNCSNETIIDTEIDNHYIDCNNCGAKISLIPTFKKKIPEVSIEARLPFIGIIIVTALIGALGACMLMSGWNFWTTFALIGGMIYLIERIFLSKYYLLKIEEDRFQEIPGLYVDTNGERFNDLVNQAISELPNKFKTNLKDVNIVIEDLPGDDTIKTLRLTSNRSLAGLYHGIPLTHRSVWHGSRIPDRITIFKKNIERYCTSEESLKNEVKRVVRHELGHFFGLSEIQLRKIEGRK